MNIRNKKRRMSETNTYKEHLQYNEKELNVKNIVFDPRQLFETCQNFTVPHYLRQNFMEPRHPLQKFKEPCHPRQNLTYATHKSTHQAI